VKFPQRSASGEETTARPQILLADDHPDVLKSLSRLLSFDFEVIAAVSSGDQALEASSLLDPDLILLDITMPGRDGFQTARDLRQRGSRARIIFLTMHESEEFVAEAFRSGARGYVLKTRLHVDLVSAVERVLAGQLFVPSLRSLLAIDESQTGHVLQFHADESAFVDSVSSFLDVALRCGDAVSVVGTEHVRAHLAKRLQGFGWNVGESGEYGRYRASDSIAAATSIMRNDHPVAERIEDYVAGLERWRATTAGLGSRLTLVGDIAGQLLLSGNVHAAMEVEHLWNDLTHTLPFLTVCCYPMTSIFNTHADLHPQLCAEHFAVAHSPEDGRRSLI
jgi:DNA-binding NarL/FixJ family response regulator